MDKNIAQKLLNKYIKDGLQLNANNIYKYDEFYIQLDIVIQNQIKPIVKMLDLNDNQIQYLNNFKIAYYNHYHFIMFKKYQIKLINSILNKGYVNYEAKDIEGQCVLKNIYAIKINQFKFVVYIIASILLAGIPALLCLWHTKCKRIFYYDYCVIQQATHFYILNYDNQFSIVKKQLGLIHKNDISCSLKIFFINRYLKYYYDQKTQTFYAVSYDYIPKLIEIVNQKKHIRGYTNERVITLRQSYGKCIMEIPSVKFSTLMARQILQPFYIFIFYTVILWYTQVYYYYPAIILIVSSISICVTIYQIIKFNRKIQFMTYYQRRMIILRQNQVIQTTSIDIVPGDIVFLRNSMKLPFDAILLGGSLLVNQCALTGESVSIVKKGIDKQTFNQTKLVQKSSIVYEGTQLIQLCSMSNNLPQKEFQEYGLMVLVIRTNFTTIKGQLIRIITFPKGKDIKFYIESVKFVIFLAVILVLLSIFTIWKIKQFGKYPDRFFIITYLYLVTINFSPALAVSIAMGIGFSLQKLSKKGIYCIAPDKVISGGRISHICFDKTGTLTQDFMDFHQLLIVQQKQFLPPINTRNKNKYLQSQNITNNLLLALNNMASCHTIMLLQHINQLTGDPMQIKLIQFGEFQLTKKSSVDKHYIQNLFSYKGKYNQGTVFRRFQFKSEVERMSVIASSSQNPDRAYVYCKGAPQSMLKIMNVKGIPENYLHILEKYTTNGFRVLAIASKQILIHEIPIISRESAQFNLEFNGFEVFENKLKPQTFEAIQIIKNARINIVIVTGDNIMTATNIAFKSGLIQKHNNVMICDLVSQDNVKVYNFNYQDDYCTRTMPEDYLNRCKTKQQPDFQCTVQQLPKKACQLILRSQGNYLFSVTGTLFAQIFKQNQYNQQQKQFLKSILVLARAKPNDKIKAVIAFQKIGRVTAMCGDGTNDCGALKQADVGLSLSQAQASIAAPFTSKIPHIKSMITLITQCRGGLVVNFSLFNIMAIYALIQYVTSDINQYNYGRLSNIQYLYQDICHNFLFVLTIGFTKSVTQLSYIKPNYNLFSVSNIVCIFYMLGTLISGQIGLIILMKYDPFASWINYKKLGGYQMYQKTAFAQYQFLNMVPESQALFIFSNFMISFCIISFAVSHPWKKSFITNIPFMIVFVIIFIYDVLIVLYPAARFLQFYMNTKTLPLDYRFQTFLLGYSLGFGLFEYISQKWILQVYFNNLRMKYPEKEWL